MNCNRSGCDGVIEEGFCTDCGKAPLKTAGGGQGVPPARTPAASTGTATGTGTGTGAGSGRSAGTGSRTGNSSSRSTGRTSSSRSSRRARSSTGHRLGGSLVSVPPVPVRDPESILMKDPAVPEDRRFCRTCERPVGRGRGDRTRIDNGFCPHDGTPFSFAPKLRAGDMVGQYRIAGCLARGGFGWVYLAIDTSVHNRWVVLKGLLGSGDADARAAAIAEQRVLAQIQHPNIVQILNIDSHPDPRTGVAETYIVMEYVGGMSLKDLLETRRKESGDRRAVLPVEHVLAYAMEILPAFGHLHSRDLVYCDFKPDNVIQTDDQLKLIDMGAVRDVNDEGGAIYGTVGYQAPEIESDGPSIESDLFTVGRTMAVLSIPFANFTKQWKYDLPPVDDIPLFQEFDSYHRLIARATHRDPVKRFATAAEMVEQCGGVLREVVAARDGEPRPALSSLFGPETRVAHADVTPLAAPPVLAAGLPVPRVDPTDAAAGLLATLTTHDPDELLSALDAAHVDSVEGSLRVVLLCIESGQTARAEALLAELEAGDPDDPDGEALDDDWRVPWYRGLAALAAGDATRAYEQFEEVRAALPGEPTPRLARAVTLELLARPGEAAREYADVWRTDRSYVSAAFGLARCRLALGDRHGAVSALEKVPDTSSHYVAAQSAGLRTRVRGRDPHEHLQVDLVAASDTLRALPLDVEAQDKLAVEVLVCALDWVKAGSAGGAGPAGGGVLGSELADRPLRFALEGRYRSLARHASAVGERIALVDRANEVRPRTWV